MEERDRILVVGGTSFVASHILKQLLEEGKYDVRMTVRSLKFNLVRLREALGDDLYNQMEVIKADLQDVETLKHACRDIKKVIIVACPFPRDMSDKSKNDE